ncbi:hypothetical protein [Limnohabitans sp.]|uniref:hypothetical protein n=1 Tax=Limnohabitans sp. TaxID=1907725 RepID=UPI0025B9DAE3|nr:hypothetical protein [Limnohabitans sp.]
MTVKSWALKSGMIGAIINNRANHATNDVGYSLIRADRYAKKSNTSVTMKSRNSDPSQARKKALAVNKKGKST